MYQRPNIRDSNPTSVRNFSLENPCAVSVTNKSCLFKFLLKESIESLVLSDVNVAGG